MRYVLECTQRGRCCHRSVITRKKDIKGYINISNIKFNDGTIMSVNIRPAKYYEKIEEIKGYNALLSKILKQGLSGFVKIVDLKGDF